MSDHDVVVQLRPSEAKLLYTSLRITQDLLQCTADVVSSASEIVEDRFQQLSKLRQLMGRVQEAPTLAEYQPARLGGLIVVHVASRRIITFSPGMTHLTGWQPDDWLEKRYTEIPGNDEPSFEQLVERATVEPFEGTVDVPLYGGRKRSMLMRARMIILGAGQVAKVQLLELHFWPH